MPGIPCNLCNRDGCRLCHLYRTDPRYRELWRGGKQKVSVSGLAEKKRH